MAKPILSVDQMRDHLNLPDGMDSGLLAGKIAAAQACVENFTAKPFADYWSDTEEAFIGIPEPLIEAVRRLAAHFYENREPVLVGSSAHTLPFDVFDLVGPYRAWSF